MLTLQNYIGGALVAPQSDKYLDNYEPATGQVYSRIPASSSVDVAAAVKVAQAAFPAWSAMDAAKRGAHMLRVAELVLLHLDKLSAAESRDNGKPEWLAKGVDIPRASENFRFFGTAIEHFTSETHAMADGSINYTLRRPIGVVGCISPWNLPLYLFTWKIAPAIAAGNCVVAKPSEITPMSAYLFSEICREAGLPPGVLNIVHGDGGGAGSAIVEHPDIKAVSFTGGTSTGKHIASVAAPMFKKLSLELGGKNATVVFADCDFERTLAETVRASFANQGQICLCGSRILVEDSIYERYRDAFIAEVKKLTVGDPKLADSRQGALVSQSHMQKVLDYIELAKEEGGTILTGGHQIKLEGRCAGGWFVAPTVIEGLGPQCRTNQEEIFGPLVTIQKFSSEQEAIENANSTDYGLAFNIWTESVHRAHRVAAQLESGIVWINCWLKRDLRTPFGGVKNSGVGREGGWEALRFFTEPQNICVGA